MSSTTSSTTFKRGLAKRRLTPDEAERAVYIDFEGRINETPVLLGIAYATGRPISDTKLVTVHYLLEQPFQRLRGACTVETLHRYEQRNATLSQALNEVIRLARSRDRLIVSWSQHELA